MADVIRNRVQRDRSILRVLRTSLVMLLTLRLRGNAFYFAFSMSGLHNRSSSSQSRKQMLGHSRASFTQSESQDYKIYTESIRLDTFKEKNFS